MTAQRQPKKQRYRYTFKCSDHGEFKKISTSQHLDDVKVVCPKCRKEDQVRQIIRQYRLGDGAVSEADLISLPPRPPINPHVACPGIVGSVTAKAVDETAKIVMEDYGMTDLRDNVRPGDTVAPKLPPLQQAKADSFFTGGPKARANQKMSRFMNNLGRSAIKGSFRPERTGSPNVVAALHERQTGLRANVITAGERRL